MQGVLLHSNTEPCAPPVLTAGVTSGAKALEQFLLLSRTYWWTMKSSWEQLVTVVGCHAQKKKKNNEEKLGL